jgi:hypothetical protein
MQAYLDDVRREIDDDETYDSMCCYYSFEQAFEDGLTPQEAVQDCFDWLNQ